jgi:hypothetical protein
MVLARWFVGTGGALARRARRRTLAQTADRMVSTTSLVVGSEWQWERELGVGLGRMGTGSMGVRSIFIEVWEGVTDVGRA